MLFDDSADAASGSFSAEFSPADQHFVSADIYDHGVFINWTTRLDSTSFIGLWRLGDTKGRAMQSPRGASEPVDAYVYELLELAAAGRLEKLDPTFVRLWFYDATVAWQEIPGELGGAIPIAGLGAAGFDEDATTAMINLTATKPIVPYAETLCAELVQMHVRRAAAESIVGALEGHAVDSGHPRRPARNAPAKRPGNRTTKR